jgi:hypothetical protein
MAFLDGKATRGMALWNTPTAKTLYADHTLPSSLTPEILCLHAFRSDFASRYS